MFIKKGFPFFEPFPAFRRSEDKDKQNLFRISIWVLKNAEFHADFKSAEKVLKNAQKNVLATTGWK
jgi:hypothetical protein